jgi:hypothetical protein
MSFDLLYFDLLSFDLLSFDLLSFDQMSFEQMLLKAKECCVTCAMMQDEFRRQTEPSSALKDKNRIR